MPKTFRTKLQTENSFIEVPKKPNAQPSENESGIQGNILGNTRLESGFLN